MRNFIFFLLTIVFLNASGQERRVANNYYVNNIINTWTSISYFEYKNDTARNISSAGDSLIKYDSVLALLLTDSKFSGLNHSDIKRINDSTEISIKTSKDKKLKVISWKIFNEMEQPSCSNIIFIKGNKNPQVIYRDDADGLNGINVQFDSIRQIMLQNKTYYVLTGSNRIDRSISMDAAVVFTISGDTIMQGSFMHGNKYSADVDCMLSIYARRQFSFRIKDNELVAPVSDENGEEIIGTKRYKITAHHVITTESD